MHRRLSALVVALLAFAGTAVASGSRAAPTTPAAVVQETHIGPDYNGGRLLPFAAGGGLSELYSSGAGRNRIGDRRKWFALDDARGEIYLKTFVLRGKGDKVEVWVTPNLDFPAGDCRNDERTEVTRSQIRYLIDQFDNNIYPKESRWFSRPPPRDGRNGLAPAYANVGPRYFRGDGEKIVVLVDNVRDENYYDSSNSRNLPYIIGFFYSQFNELTDRNVLTIDGYDWIHRTRADPPHEPVANDPCNSKPARPFLIEETLAHEYQHLLEHYEDGDEETWLNEGLADWAQTLTGYARPARPVTELGFDRHVQCFLGYCNQLTDYNPNPIDMGPENSLTVWRDQTSAEVLADYGAAYTFMELMSSRYGRPFMRALHRNDLNGLDSLQQILTATQAGTDVRTVIDDWTAMVALDDVLDDGAVLHGGEPSALMARRLHASINWSTTHAFSSPGAPPNGSDYVRLRASDGTFLTADALNSLEFEELSGRDPSELTVRLVAYGQDRAEAWITRLELHANGKSRINAQQLSQALGTTATTVAAIVTFHDPEELTRSYALYRLTVNGVVQPGGS
ncbi:MAG: hypothetical protein ACLGIB_12805 [Actinomycetota bacterium]